MIPLHAPALNLVDMAAFPDDNYIDRFKQVLCKSHDKKTCIFTSDGRNALYLALKLMRLKKYDEIIIPSYICKSVESVIKQFCKPVYADIDPKSYNIDAEDIERKITRNTKAILVAHLYGNPVNLDRILDITRDKRLVLIEDVAQAFNGKYMNKSLGSFGDFSIFSFRFTKDITSFKGGALSINHSVDLNLRTQSMLGTFINLSCTIAAMKQIKIMPSSIYAPLKNYFLFPFFNKSSFKFSFNGNALSNYQCYLLYRQFQRIDKIIDRRINNAKYYSKELCGVTQLPEETRMGKHTYYRYTIQSSARDKLYNHLLKNGIEADKMYNYCLYPHSNSYQASIKNLNIPVHHELSMLELEKIIGVIYEFQHMERFSK